MYEHILVPVDGSEASMDAVEHAAALADSHGAVLHVLNAAEPQAAVESAGVDIVGVMEDIGQEAIDDAETNAAEQGVEDVRTSLVHGTPHRSIIDYAEDNDVDLIVMGTHGRTGLGRLLLGSVTEKVVRVSPVPVLTVRPSEAE
jgi:nucleotide-binding universal stress UspA family protein